MRAMQAGVCALLLAFAGASFAEVDSRAEAEALFEAIDMRVTVDQNVGVMLDAQIKQRPDLAPYRNVMQAYFEKYMGYDALKDDLIGLYMATFTGKELREVRKFAETTAGRKVIVQMPMLMRQGAEIGTKRAQEHLAELQQMVKDETDRLNRARKP